MFKDIKGLEREMGLGLGVYREKVTREIMGLGFKERDGDLDWGLHLKRDIYWGLRLLIDRYILGINGRGREKMT